MLQRPSHNLIGQLTARRHLEHASHARERDEAAPGQRRRAAVILRRAGLDGTCYVVASYAPDLLDRVDRIVRLADGVVVDA